MANGRQAAWVDLLELRKRAWVGRRDGDGLPLFEHLIAPCSFWLGQGNFRTIRTVSLLERKKRKVQKEKAGEDDA
jgi:hypothetical protein